MQKITLPKCCVSCEHYTHKGYDNDILCPFKNKSRTAFGECKKHKSNVFSTEICNLFEKIEGIDVTCVLNRERPKEVRQDKLF